METSSSAGTITGALASSLDSAKADRNALPRVLSSKGRAPSSSMCLGFRVGRVELWQSALWTICPVRGLPVLGNIHQLDVTKLHLILERWAAQYGPVYLFRMGSAPVVVLSDPKWSDQVLRARPETFTRDFAIAPIFSEIGAKGVFSAEGDAWRAQRRLATLALAQRHLRGLYPIFRPSPRV